MHGVIHHEIICHEVLYHEITIACLLMIFIKQSNPFMSCVHDHKGRDRLMTYVTHNILHQNVTMGYDNV